MRAELYTDTARHDLTRYLTSLTLTRSISAPYASAELVLATDAHRPPPYLTTTTTGAPSLDAWAVISDDEGRALHIGPLVNISESIMRGGEGTLSRTLRLSIASPLHTLERATIALSAKSVNAAGVYDLKAWGPRLRALIKAPFSSNQIGAVLARTYDTLAATYRLPLTLANGATLDAIPVIYSETRAQRYAPERAADLRSVHGLAVNSISTAANPQGSPWGLLSSSFDVEPNMIELFYSLEPHTRGPVSRALGGATPCLIYRLKPFIEGRVSSNAAASIDAINEETRQAARTPHRIPAAQVISYQAQTSDADRINGVYLDSPFTASQGVETFGLTISPSIDSDDTRRAGLRLYKARWPFFPPKARGQSIASHLAYVQDIAAAIIGQAHRYSRASLSTAYRPDLRAGLWISAELPHARLIGYLESVSHNVDIEPQSGALMRRSNLTLTRCFYEESAR